MILEPPSVGVDTGGHLWKRLRRLSKEGTVQCERKVSHLFLRQVHWWTGEALGTLKRTAFQWIGGRRAGSHVGLCCFFFFWKTLDMITTYFLLIRSYHVIVK